MGFFFVLRGDLTIDFSCVCGFCSLLWFGVCSGLCNFLCLHFYIWVSLAVF